MAAKKKGNHNRVNVEFLQDYAAKRGASIMGQKGDVRTYPMSPDLKRCIDEDICKITKKGAAERETATDDEREES